jgi:P63C domain-containing protein
MTDDSKAQAAHADRASKGGAARMQKLTRAERQALASQAARARWKRPQNQPHTKEAGITETRADEMPEARYPGSLNLAGVDIPVYVLSNGQRVIARIAATEVLTGVKRQADLESYLRVEGLKPYIDLESVRARMVTFRQKEVEMLNQTVAGLPSDLFIEICQAYVSALNASQNPESGVTLTDRQKEIAIKAGMFLAACAKVGLDALIDEATGYQYLRPEDALAIKLKLYLEEEMRKWEPTFPNELWEQFGRLTNWKGRLHKRPKYWGKLVMELIYEYLDPDVAQWLRDNAPKPQRGQNYHQWLTSQYGLRKLVEHIWKVVGIASTCADIHELKQRMEELYGKRAGFQFELRLKGASA